jgi:hypothetical protein
MPTSSAATVTDPSGHERRERLDLTLRLLRRYGAAEVPVSQWNDWRGIAVLQPDEAASSQDDRQEKEAGTQPHHLLDVLPRVRPAAGSVLRCESASPWLYPPRIAMGWVWDAES